MSPARCRRHLPPAPGPSVQATDVPAPAPPAPLPAPHGRPLSRTTLDPLLAPGLPHPGVRCPGCSFRVCRGGSDPWPPYLKNSPGGGPGACRLSVSLSASPQHWGSWLRGLGSGEDPGEKKRQLWALANLGTQGGRWPGLQRQVSRLWCGCRAWAAPVGLALCGLGCPPRSLYPCPDPEPGTRAQPRALQNPRAFCPTRQGWGRQRPPAGARAMAALPAGAVIWENHGWASFCQGFARPPSRGVPSEPLSGPAFQVLWWDRPRQEASSHACRMAPPRLVSRVVWPGRPLLDVVSWWLGALPAGCVPGGQQSLRRDF